MNKRLRVAFLLVSSVVALACTSNSQSSATPDRDAGFTVVFLDAGARAAVSPDGTSSCPIAACNYQTQEGCASGQMCHPSLNADSVSPACVSAGTRTVGETCAWQQCAPGLFCAGDGHCRHLCCGGDWSVCESNESCTEAIQLQAVDSASPTPAGVSICEPTDDCDVLDPQSCPAGKSCYIVDSRAGTKCMSTGGVPFNGACSATKLCAAGLTCVQNSQGTGSACRRLCRAVAGGGEPGCPEAEGGYCAHFVRDPLGVGECTPTL
jgi:hypothetical protein